ncbi:MAG: helix-turn-helix domain-containing protein, partial [Polyangiales bacterium]
MDRHSSKDLKTARDWVTAGLAVLAQQGADAIKVEPLARELGVTKGSFYWHFRDRDALLKAILSHWQTVATAARLARVDALGGTPAERRAGRVVTRRPGQPPARHAHPQPAGG